MLFSKQQALILLLQVPDAVFYGVVSIRPLPFLLPQVHFTAGNAVLEGFQLMDSFRQLFRKLPAGGFFIRHPVPLGLKIVFPQGRILGLGLLKPTLCVFLLLRLSEQLTLQVFQVGFAS